MDATGDLFIAVRHRIREVNLSTGIITTVAGNGSDGYSGDGGQATDAELGDPQVSQWIPPGISTSPTPTTTSSAR